MAYWPNFNGHRPFGNEILFTDIGFVLDTDVLIKDCFGILSE